MTKMGDKYHWDGEKGRKDPFAVPEGYFDSFTERMMQVLPEVEAPVTVVRKKPVSAMRMVFRMVPVVGAAAMLALAVIYKQYYIEVDTPKNMPNPMAQTLHHDEAISSETTYKYVADDAYDYLMLDNNKIYEYEMEEYE